MKKFTCIILSLVMLMCALPSVYAAGELNNAFTYYCGTTVSDSILINNEVDTFKFDLTTSGKITISVMAQIEGLRFKLYDSTGKELWGDTQWWNSTIQQISFKKDIELTQGTYYFSISEYDGYGNYSMKIDFLSATESFSEGASGNNNSVLEATSINTNTTYKGQIALNDTVDTYKFALPSSGKIDLSLMAQMENVKVALYDSYGEEIWYDYLYWNSTVQQISFQQEFHLTEGLYYFSVSKNSYYGNYNFSLNYLPANESFAEAQNGTNNTLADAVTINNSQMYNGQIAMNDSADTYKISLLGNEELVFNASMENAILSIYDSTGNRVWYDYLYWNDQLKQISFKKELELTTGIYYISVSKNSRYGNYTFYCTNGIAPVKPAVSGDPNAITVILNNIPVTFDQPPIIDNGRTLVPVRAIFEALGATVSWDQPTQTVSSTRGAVSIQMTIGSSVMYRNYAPITLDVPPQIVNGRTLVPVRAIAEAYGCRVSWDNATRTVTITG